MSFEVTNSMQLDFKLWGHTREFSGGAKWMLPMASEGVVPKNLQLFFAYSIEYENTTQIKTQNVV